ncbi:MAG: hypothetical protein U0T85_01215 [Cloacibacterium normanense]
MKAEGIPTNILIDIMEFMIQKLATLNNQISKYEIELGSLPYKQQKFVDAQRGLSVNETTYSTLLRKLSEARTETENQYL